MEKRFEEFTNFIVIDLLYWGTFCFWFVSVEDNNPPVFIMSVPWERKPLLLLVLLFLIFRMTFPTFMGNRA